jgi:hypothetical protein
MLGVSRRELPPVVEHLEAVVADMWVRSEVGAVHRDPLGDRMFLQTLLSKGPAQDAMQADLRRATTNQAATPSSSSSNHTTPSGLYWTRSETQIPFWLFIVMHETLSDG